MSAPVAFARAMRRLERLAVRLGYIGLSQTFAVVRERAGHPGDEQWMRDAAVYCRRQRTRRGRRMARMHDRAAMAVEKLRQAPALAHAAENR